MVSGMHRRNSRGVIALLALWCGLVAPSSAAPAAGEEGSSSAQGVPSAAYAHLEALTALGPRPPGSDAAVAAADYIRRQLSSQGLEVAEFTAAGAGDLEDAGPPPRILVAEIPGESSDVVVAFAPFGSEPFETFRFVGANDGASGAAVLLELASALAREPLPYTTWIAFTLGDRDPSPGEDPASAVPASRLLVRELEKRGALSRVRLAVYWNQVGDRDLQISRDLYSDRVARGAFFREAERLGFDAQFPAAAPFDSLTGGHHAFWAVGMRRVVALVDDRFGGTEPPGAYWHTEEDTAEMCAPESLDAVLRVSEAGLRATTARLAMLDARSRRSALREPVAARPPQSVSEQSLSASEEWEAGP